MEILQAPKLSSIVARPAENRGLAEIEKTFSFISPVFGGGVHLHPKDKEPTKDQSRFKEHDSITPVRVSAIRGQLRFWWRATSTYKDLAELKSAEDKIWGAASQPSLVSIMILKQPTVNDVEVFDMVQSQNSRRWNPYPKKDKKGLAYAAFPLQPKGGQQQKLQPGVLHTFGGTISITIQVSTDYQDEVKRAVDAWMIFGGLGGRTRRGFGAVFCSDSKDPKEFLKSLPKNLVAISGVPSLKHAQIEHLTCREKDGESALNSGLEKLLRFRQGEGKGRKKGEGNQPGRSWWPEAESIRNITKRRLLKHAKMDFGTSKFPRAAFGMPIIFHFKDSDPKKENSEPNDTILAPKGKNRRASSLIIRPFKSGNVYDVFALVLTDETRSLEQLVLSGENNQKDVEHQLDPEESAWSNSPLIGHEDGPRQSKHDVLKAFLNFFKS